MATITKKRVLSDAQFGGVPYGNRTVLPFQLKTNAIGAAVDTDTAAAVGNGDKVYLGLLPAGFLLQDAVAIVSDAFSASVTANIGFEYVDGVDSTAVPQDADYFFAALALSATSRTRMTVANAPVKLPKDAYLVVTTGGAANAVVGVLDILVEGELVGAP